MKAYPEFPRHSYLFKHCENEKIQKIVKYEKVMSESYTLEYSHDDTDNTLVPNQVKNSTLS